MPDPLTLFLYVLAGILAVRLHLTQRAHKRLLQEHTTGVNFLISEMKRTHDALHATRQELDAVKRRQSSERAVEQLVNEVRSLNGILETLERNIAHAQATLMPAEAYQREVETLARAVLAFSTDWDAFLETYARALSGAPRLRS